jgi:hypothetical protein
MTQNDEALAIHTAFDTTGINFHSRPDTLAALKATGSEITFAEEDGLPYCRYDGEILDLASAISRLAMDNKSLSDNRTLPRNGAGAARPGIASKSDFTTRKDASDFITKHGFDAYQRLPLTAIDSSEIRNQADFLKLPPKERSRRYGLDPNCFAKLPKAPAPNPNEKATSQKQVMADNLAREVAKRGKR